MGFLNFISERVSRQPTFKTRSISHDVGSGIAKIKRLTGLFGTTEWGEARAKYYDKYLNLYTYDARVHRAIEETVQQVVYRGYHLESEDKEAIELLERNLEHVDFEIKLPNMVKQTLIWGDVYDEKVFDVNEKDLSNLKILNSRYIKVNRDPYGKVIDYVQDLRNFGNGEYGVIHLKPESILHMCHDRVGDAPYGTSIISPIYFSLNTQMEIESDSLKILKRYHSPFYLVKVGDKEHHPSDAVIDSFSNDMEKIEPDHDWVVPYYVDVEEKGVQGKVLDITPYFGHFETQILTGLGLPMFEMGRPEGTNRAQASEAKGVFDRRIKSFQREFSCSIEKNLFRDILDRNGIDSKVEFVFGSLREGSSETPELLPVLGLSALASDTRRDVENLVRLNLGLEPLSPEEYEKAMETKPEEKEEDPKKSEEKIKEAVAFNESLPSREVIK